MPPEVYRLVSLLSCAVNFDGKYTTGLQPPTLKMYVSALPSRIMRVRVAKVVLEVGGSQEVSKSVGNGRVRCCECDRCREYGDPSVQVVLRRTVVIKMRRGTLQRRQWEVSLLSLGEDGYGVPARESGLQARVQVVEK